MTKNKKFIPLFILFLIIGIHLLFLTQIAFWPYQEFRVYPYLTSQGFIPYKELIDQHFPGLFFFPVNLYTLGLATPLGLRMLQLVIVTITQILIYVILKKITKSSQASLFGNILFLFGQPLYEGYVLWVDSFTTPLLLASFYLLLQTEDKKIILSRKSLFFSGIFLALSLLFKQPLLIIFVILLGYLLLKKVNYERIGYFILGFIMPLVYLVIYIQQLGVWKEFWYWNFTFNQTVYPKYFFRSPTYKESFFLLAIILPFFLCSLYLFKKKNKYTLLLLAYAIPVLILLYGTWAFVHVQPFLPFAIILITLFFLSWSKRTKLLASAYLIFMLLLMLIHVYDVGNSSTFADARYVQLIQKMEKLHVDGKSIYLDNMPAELYQLSGTVPANRLYVPNYPWYNALLEGELTESVQKNKPDVIIIPVQSGKTQITSYIQSTYKKASITDSAEIWEKK